MSPDEACRAAAAHAAAGRLDAAVRTYRGVLAAHPGHVPSLVGLGEVLERAGRPKESEKLYRRAIAAGGRAVPLHLKLASVQKASSRWDASLASARYVLAIEPDNAAANCFAALALERKHDLDGARAAARRSLAANPNMAPARLALGRILRRTGDLEEAHSFIEESLGTSGLPPDVRAGLESELGTVHDRLGGHAAAYAAFERSGRALLDSPAGARVKRHLMADRIATYRAVITPEYLRERGWIADAPADQLDDGLPAPSFLVGFPRSGTTMAEQILAAHPEVVTTEERPTFSPSRERMRRETGPDASLETALHALDRDAVLRLRKAYWERVRMLREIDPATKTVVDKNPLTLVDLGLANVLFPEARVIVLLRDPRDACLSCFRQFFGLNPAMIHMTTLESTVALYEKVMGWWLSLRETLTIPFIEVRYEDLVRDLETHARRMVDLLGVEWSDDVLRFQQLARERTISTPSYEAVTEKPHTRAIGRWRDYREQFEPLLGQLEPFVEAFGYEA